MDLVDSIERMLALFSEVTATDEASECLGEDSFSEPV